jgi:uncharacterized protein
VNAASSLWQRLKARVRAEIPSRDELQRHRWLAPVAHRLSDANLWHMKPESLARGVAIGTFWAFVIPFGQIIAAAAHCIWWRANIPVAAAITFITNPFTVGFWLYLGYRFGQLLLGLFGIDLGNGQAGTSVLSAEGLSWLEKAQAIGWPTILGMGTFAVGGALIGYFGVRWGAWVWFLWRYQRRLRRRDRA